jgi:hypothetical protein
MPPSGPQPREMSGYVGRFKNLYFIGMSVVTITSSNEILLDVLTHFW